MNELESAIVEWVSHRPGCAPGFIVNEFQLKGYPSYDINKAFQAMLAQDILFEQNGVIFFKWPEEDAMSDGGFGSQLLNHISDDNKKLAVPDYIRAVMEVNEQANEEVRVPTGHQKNPAVHSPSHYTRGGIEAIDFIEAKGLGFCLGNVVKYVSRAGFKADAKLQDLEKAQWYLTREIERIKKGE